MAFYSDYNFISKATVLSNSLPVQLLFTHKEKRNRIKAQEFPRTSKILIFISFSLTAKLGTLTDARTSQLSSLLSLPWHWEREKKLA